MSGTTNAQKRPYARDLHEFGDKKSQDWLQRQPKEVPVTIVSVAYPYVTASVNMNSKPYTLPHITMPMATSAYDYIPVQAGDQGMAIVADYYLGGVSGLGGGTADLTPRGNLSTCVYLPITSKGFTQPIDPNKRQIQGPAGVIIQTSDGTVRITVSETVITVDPGSTSKMIFLGGDGVTGTYDFVMAGSSNSINVKARTA